MRTSLVEMAPHRGQAGEESSSVWLKRELEGVSGKVMLEEYSWDRGQVTKDFCAC